MSKDDDKKPTLNELPDAFQKGVEEGLNPNDERVERLKEAIRNHAKANRKTVKVKARRAPR